MAGEFVFEIEYVDRASGNAVTRTVSEMRLAQKLARELAIAHGKRAMIRRVSAGETWSLILVVPDADGQSAIVRRRLTKREAIVLWRHWNYKRKGAVMLLWPDSAALPRRFAG